MQGAIPLHEIKKEVIKMSMEEKKKCNCKSVKKEKDKCENCCSRDLEKYIGYRCRWCGNCGRIKE